MSTIRVDRITPYQSGSVAIEGLNITNLTIDGTLTASLQQGYVWVGNSAGRTTTVPTSSFGGGGGSDITALNSFTASQQVLNTTFATTGSNTFVGSQNIQGTLTASMQEGFTLVGGVGNISTLVATSSLGGGSLPSGVVSGSSQLTASYDERYALSGSVGTAIATGSFATTGSNTFIGTETISGSILVSGSINSDGYELDGSTTTTIPVLNTTFDATFSSSEHVTINKSLVLGDGKVLVAGRFESIDGHTTNDIARFNSDGTIDTGFTSPVFGGYFGGDAGGFINTFVTQSDNKIIVAGNFGEVNGDGNRMGLARLNANGTLDNSFTSQSWGSFGEVRDIAIQSDGKIVCAGDFTSGSRRINTDGTLDTSFDISQGNNQALSFNNGNFYSVALLDSGSEQAILIGGDFVQWGSYSYPYLVKLNPNGTLDFGFAGSNLDLITGGDYTDRIEKIKVGDDGNIYISGKFRDTGVGNHAGFARVTPDDQGNGVGALDNGFRTYISGSFVNDFDFYDGDKILLGGNFTTFGNPGFFTTSANRFAIVDQNDGGLVNNWITDTLAAKYVFSAETSANRSVNSVTLLPNDNVLAGGPFTFVSGDYRTTGGLASLKLTGFGDVTTTSEYTITADSTRLLVSSSTTQFSGDVNIIGSVTASEFSGSFVGDGSGLTGITTTLDTGSFATTGSNTFNGEQTISSSLIVTNEIKGTGSIFLQPDANDARKLEIYNTAATDVHIKSNGGLTFLGDDTNYVLVDSYTQTVSITSVNDVFVSGSVNVTGAVSASSFTGSFIGDGSGLTGITSTLPSDILSSSVTNFTDFSQSVDTRISSIVTGTGFATTGSNTFVGNQVITGSLTLSSSAAVELRVVGDSVLSGSLTVTGSITIPGSGSLVNFVANPTTMRSVRGNGAGLYNIVEQSDGNVAFTLTRIGTGELTAAITSNISGSTINGSFSDNTTTTSGAGRGARLRGFISGGVVTSVQIDTSNSSLGYEEYGQPASRQGIGYRAGDTLTIAQSLNQVTGSLTITLRQQDIDTYFGIDPRVSFDYKQYGILTTRAGIISSGSISVGAGVNTLGGIYGNSIAAGTDVNVTSDYSIAVGRDLYNDNSTAYANATFGMHHSSSNYAQTIVGIGSRLDDTGEGAFVVGNGTTGFGTDPLTRSNLLVAQGSKVQVTGSLDVSGNGYVILSKVSASYNYADDTAAQAGGVPLGGLYHTSGTIKIRLA